jgi:CRISPR system Cascade subunit CasA
MTEEKAFNLIDEPWIRVMDTSGAVREVGLLECFRRAHKVKCLAGELPTQDVAVLRLLLAVVYAVFARETAVAKMLPQWRDLWERGSFDSEAVEGYLRDHAERFWLFHPETPFFQTAGLHTKDGKINSVSPIVCDVPSRAERRFFCPRNGEELESLSFAEAARWLVALHAWDYAGKKASIVGGDPNGGGTGWLGKLGVVYAERENLFETLLLNMVLIDAAQKPVPLGRPFWEEEPAPIGKRERRPGGYVELLTWQSRRVLLFGDEGRVTGVLASYGDVFEKENTLIEQMSGWHYSSQKGQENDYIPNLHSSDRSAWRDLGSLLPQADGKSRPGIVAWAALLADKGVLPDFTFLRLKTIGLEYGTMMAVVNELISDGIEMNTALLTELGAQWIQMVFDVLAKTESAVLRLGRFAGDLVESSGGGDRRDSEDLVRRAREQAYFAFDAPFRKWLLSLDPSKGEEDKMEKALKWLETIRSVLLGQAEALYGEAGKKAMTGVTKFNEKTNRTEYCNAFTAFSRFRNGLAKIISGTGGKK